MLYFLFFCFHFFFLTVVGLSPPEDLFFSWLERYVPHLPPLSRCSARVGDLPCNLAGRRRRRRRRRRSRSAPYPAYHV